MSLEFVLLAPLFIVFMMFLVAVGRVVDVQSQINGAARDAARAASTGRSPEAAASLAREAVEYSIGGTSWCKGGPQVTPDVSEFGPGGQVTVTVQCDADLSGVAFSMPVAKAMRGRALAFLDEYPDELEGTPLCRYPGGDEVEVTVTIAVQPQLLNLLPGFSEFKMTSTASAHPDDGNP
ncbi:pilus assembly protein [Actinomadura craniellae]|uniref:Pilus assembly protein n=1 Tax=Actinomadura craniellae TaxID=2231787 RepID=A0A365GZN7_9ACTN|nr:pilus assembly protein [Actinomadura craniellae]